MKNLAVIPARGGSKRIPKKNIRDFLGKPVIAYSIEAALKSNLFDEVMVSTDDPQIAEIGKKFGASIPFMRSRKNANDFAPLADVILEVISEYRRIGRDFDNICCLYSAAPFVSAELVKKGYDFLINEKRPAILPVVPFPAPIQRALYIDNLNNLNMIKQENINVRSQDLQRAYYDAGQFFWIRSSVLLKYKTVFVQGVGALELSENEVQDIDTERDWEIAEMKYKLLYFTDNS